jgi:hypothetical protein
MDGERARREVGRDKEGEGEGESGITTGEGGGETGGEGKKTTSRSESCADMLENCPRIPFFSLTRRSHAALPVFRRVLSLLPLQSPLESPKSMKKDASPP